MTHRFLSQMLVAFCGMLSTACGGGSAADCPAGGCEPSAGIASAAVDPIALPVVYSWSERSKATVVVNGHTITALDNYDPLPDVARVVEGFKEANIVDRAADGSEQTLFDCISDDNLHCAALDPRVSPDNRKIAFAVVYGTAVTEGHSTMATGRLPIKVLSNVRTGQIFIYDTQSKALQSWPRVEGVIDMHPEWISNDTLVFVSDRARTYPVQMPNKSPSYKKHYALQRWTAQVDGSNAVNIGQHDDMALHPLVLSDGNILSATWRVDEKLSAGVTPENQFWMTMTDQFGGGEFSVLGAHGEQFKQDGAVNAVLALHFYGELANGDLLTSNYYRGRHMGLGMPVGMPRLPHGVEGVGSDFMPAIYSLLPWAQEEDNPTHFDANGIPMGNGGYPSGLPGGQVLLTKGTGFCYDGLLPQNANAAYLKGPGCDTGIYVLKSIPSAHPSDLARVVDHPDRHEFSADVRLPYASTYGRAAPAAQRRQDQGFCSIKVVNARLGQLHSGGAACTKHGACIQPGFSVADIARLAIYEAKPNLQVQSVIISEPLEGQEMTLLGYAVPESDGSVNARIPCDTPYKLRGVSANGTEFIRDQVKHSNRPGEGRLCLGCHAGHTMADHRPDTAALFSKTIAGSKAAVPLTR